MSICTLQQQTRLRVQFQCRASDNYLPLSEHDGEIIHPPDPSLSCVMMVTMNIPGPGEPPPVSTPASSLLAACDDSGETL